MATQQELCVQLEQGLAGAVNSNERLIYRGRDVQADLILQVGATPFLLSIAHGRVARCSRPIPLFARTHFAMRGTVRAWDEFWEPTPRPGWHDIFALMKRREMTIDGDMRPFFRHLEYWKDVFSAPRRCEQDHKGRSEAAR